MRPTPKAKLKHNKMNLHQRSTTIYNMITSFDKLPCVYSDGYQYQTVSGLSQPINPSTLPTAQSVSVPTSSKKKKIGKKNKRHQTIYLVKLTRNCTQLKINNKKQ